MRVAEVMSQPVITCHVDDKVDVPVHRMRQEDCGAIPVVDGAGALVGMVTDRDACLAVYRCARAMHDVPVRDAMRGNLWTCAPESTVEDAARIMATHQVRRLPVVDGEGGLVGIVSVADLLRRASSEVGMVEVLRAISMPRPATQPRKAHAARSVASDMTGDAGRR